MDVHIAAAPLGITDPAEARVALINPPQTYPARLEGEFQSYLPLGLASLAGQVRALGVPVTILDCLDSPHVERGEGWVRFGRPEAEIVDHLLAERPAIVGISNPFSMFIEDTRRTARLVKRILPGALVVFGGIEASLAERAIHNLEIEPAFDIAVRGEGEMAFADLIRAYDPARREVAAPEAIPGIFFRAADGGIRETGARPFLETLDTLALPAYDLLDVEAMYANPRYAARRFRQTQTRCAPMHTSRGCPYKCSFCSVHSQVGYRYRSFSISYILDHVRHLKEKFGVTHFHFEDDNLTLNPKRTREFFTALAELGITWDTPNGIRADTIDDEVAGLMKAAGATTITVAVESGDQDVLSRIVNKRLDLEAVERACAALHRQDIPTVSFFIIGFPGESEANIRTTLRYARHLTQTYGVLCVLFVATPLPGTPLHRQCEQEHLFTAELNNETLLSAIRLNQIALISTDQFTKSDLLRWAEEELAGPDMICVGTSIPMFWAANATTDSRARRAFGDIDTMQPYEWRFRFEADPTAAPAVTPLMSA